MRFACVLLNPKDEHQQLALAEACLRFSPDIALGKLTVFLEIGRCRSLYTDESLLKRMQVLFRRFRISARASIASDLPTSFALALYGVTDRRKLPVDALHCYFSPFTFDLTLQRMLGSLKKLGVETLDEFIRLPHSSIAKKFGKEGLLAMNRYVHADQVVWNRFQVAEKILEQLTVESHEALYEFESITFMLKRILDRVLMRTRGLGKLVSKMSLKFHLDTYHDLQETEREWLLEFSFPHRSVKAFLEMIRDRVGSSLQRSPLPAPVIRIEIEVVESVNGNPSQFHLFSQKEEEQEGIDLLMERIVDKLGEGSVFYASCFESYLPERSWKKSLVPGKMNSKIFRRRPLILFAEAEPIRKLDQYFILRQYRWKILDFIGPEKITGEWWIGDQARDYYEVHTDREILWVYQNPATEELFLHGVFD